jgi:pimeloyl-ACP methyl ester carboxylesterase
MAEMRFEVYGEGPCLFVGWPLRATTSPPAADPTAPVRQRYLDQLTGAYRVVLMDYPPTGDDAAAVIDSFTPDRVCAEILDVADAAGIDRFAWYGYSWGGVVGLQLAARTNRLTALVCGGWPPLGAPYAEMLVWAEGRAQRTGLPDWAMTATYYRQLVSWPERDALSIVSCPRMAFARSGDVIVSEGTTFHVGPLLAEHRAELEEMGWTVQLVDGDRHDVFMHPDVVVPLVRGFLDPLLIRR